MFRSISDSLVVVAAVAALGGCMLQSPEYDGTAFSCAEPPFSCPDGFSCVAEVCVATPGSADATPVDDDEPDARVNVPGDPDAGINLVEQTLTFGERGGAQVANVTFDSFLEAEYPLEEFGNDERIRIDADPLKVGLLRFDLTAIGAGAQIVSADLTLYVVDPIEDGEYVANPLIVSWDENEANYVYRDDNQLWPAPGAGAGSFSPTRMGAFAPPVADVDAVMSLSATAVQAWVDSPQTNYGMRIIADSPEGRGGRFASSDEPDNTTRPLLTVTFLAPQ